MLPIGSAARRESQKRDACTPATRRSQQAGRIEPLDCSDRSSRWRMNSPVATSPQIGIIFTRLTYCNFMFK